MSSWKMTGQPSFVTYKNHHIFFLYFAVSSLYALHTSITSISFLFLRIRKNNHQQKEKKKKKTKLVFEFHALHLELND
jgi:hypothetical protein